MTPREKSNQGTGSPKQAQDGLLSMPRKGEQTIAKRSKGHAQSGGTEVLCQTALYQPIFKLSEEKN